MSFFSLVSSWDGLLILGLFVLGYGGSFLFYKRMKRTKEALRDTQNALVLQQEEKKELLLKHEEKKLSWLESLGEGYISLDGQHRILLINSQGKRLLNHPRPEGELLLDALRNEALADVLQKALLATERTHFDFILAPSSPLCESKEGGEQAWRLDVAPLSDPKGGKRLLFRDITLSYQTDQIRKDFVANASHELRTPLTIVIGYIEALLDEGFLESFPDKSRQFLSTMQKHGTRLSRIVEDMLMISKLESEQKNLLKEEVFSLRECAQDVFSRLESIRAQKKAIFFLHISENIYLKGDKFYWTQILFNLTENALKQNLQPYLEVTLESKITPEGELTISVCDDGIGIPATHLPYIFKRFYRVETHHAQEIKGTGLGLSIVKRAVESHEGRISVESTPGLETRFLMSLPPQRFLLQENTENTLPTLS